VRRVSLALQGGGAHGAFTWGVLDRLLEEPGLEIAAVSGTSAGALNAAALKAGLVEGGAEAARARLAELWREVGALGDVRVLAWVRSLFPWAMAAVEMAGAASPVSPAALAAQVYTPYAWGPLWQNPLAPVVEGFDFTRVCAGQGPALFVSATNVRTGRIRVFSGTEISPPVLLASACLPTIFQAVEIDDPVTGAREAYSDGGFTGNPALFPLYRPDLPDDIAVVSINPMRRDAVPMTPVDIQDRVNEISFNAALLGELRAIAFVKRLIAEGRMPRGAMKDVNLHLIGDEALMNDLGAGTKLRPTAGLIERLFDAGRRAADGFLRDHGGRIGVEGSVDPRALFG
jgi:NTE family protein